MKIAALYPADTSAAADVRSTWYDLGDLTTFAIAVDFTGADLAGTLYLECSNDQTDFVVVTGSSQAVTAAASHVWNVQNAGYRYIRVFWDYTSGTGNIAAKLVAKELYVKGA